MALKSWQQRDPLQGSSGESSFRSLHYTSSVELHSSGAGLVCLYGTGISPLGGAAAREQIVSSTTALRIGDLLHARQKILTLQRAQGTAVAVKMHENGPVGPSHTIQTDPRSISAGVVPR